MKKEHPEHTGIGHTRWATHGVPSNMNSHPHTNESETISIVHNGIIENYASIKECLLEQGYTFQSQTDSEVIVHMLDYYYQGDMMYALKNVCNTFKVVLRYVWFVQIILTAFLSQKRKSNDFRENRYICILCK